MITQDELKSILKYDPNSGDFTWIKKISRKVIVGNVAGCTDRDGYKVLRIFKRLYRAHRLAFLYMTGEFPKFGIDHIDGNPSNNSFKNLREATQVENMRNVGLQANNTSGAKGVGWMKSRGKWYASAKLRGKKIFLGYYSDFFEAKNAYQYFALNNHGDFYRET